MFSSLVMSGFVMHLQGTLVARLRIFLKKSSLAESMRSPVEHIIGQWWGWSAYQRLHGLSNKGCNDWTAKVCQVWLFFWFSLFKLFSPVKTNYSTKSIMLSYCHKQVDFSQALTLDSCSVTLFKIGLTVKAAFQSHFHWKYKYIQTFSWKWVHSKQMSLPSVWCMYFSKKTPESKALSQLLLHHKWW